MNFKTLTSIENYKLDVKKLVAENLEEAFNKIEPISRQSIHHYNAWTIQRGRYLDTVHYFNRNIADKTNLDIERSKIREALISMIDGFSQADLNDLINEIEVAEKVQQLELYQEENKQKIKTLEEQNAYFQNQQDQFSKEIELQRSRNELMIMELNDKNKELRTTTENLEQARQSIDYNQSIIAKLKDENEKLYGDKKILSAFEKKQIENEKMMILLQSENEKLNEEIRELKEMEKTNQRNKKIIDTLQAKLKNLETENEELKNKVEEIQVGKPFAEKKDSTSYLKLLFIIIPLSFVAYFIGASTNKGAIPKPTIIRDTVWLSKSSDKTDIYRSGTTTQIDTTQRPLYFLIAYASPDKAKTIDKLQEVKSLKGCSKAGYIWGPDYGYSPNYIIYAGVFPEEDNWEIQELKNVLIKAWFDKPYTSKYPRVKPPVQ